MRGWRRGGWVGGSGCTAETPGGSLRLLHWQILHPLLTVMRARGQKICSWQAAGRGAGICAAGAGLTCTLALMFSNTPVRHSSTSMTVKPVTIWASGVCAPTELLTAEREKEPVVVYLRVEGRREHRGERCVW